MESIVLSRASLEFVTNGKQCGGWDEVQMGVMGDRNAIEIED